MKATRKRQGRDYITGLHITNYLYFIMIEMCALASGSNGNCYFIGNPQEAVLVDAGISARQLMKRFETAGLDPLRVRAIFISHEHSDHTRGMQVLSKRLGIRVYMTSRTYYSLPRTFRPEHVAFFTPGQILEVGLFRVHSFLKNHDAAEPCSFRVEYGGKSVGILTDIGEPCDNVKAAVKQCHALFLESNYDETMLWNGNYPVYLKKRIASHQGHLSNVQASALIRDFAHSGLEYLFLSHLSKENNTPDLAHASFLPFHGTVSVRLTSRQEAGEVVRMDTHLPGQ